MSKRYEMIIRKYKSSFEFIYYFAKLTVYFVLLNDKISKMIIVLTKNISTIEEEEPLFNCFNYIFVEM